MSSISVRWSEHEARKPYARPFGVSFAADDGRGLGGIAVSGPDLLYYRQFQVAVLALLGEVFRERAVEAAEDVQRAWLEVVAGLIPALSVATARLTSSFDEQRGRLFSVDPQLPGQPWVAVEAERALEYQDFQASLAHQTGALYRHRGVEAVTDPEHRQRAWLDELGRLCAGAAGSHPEELVEPAWPYP